MGIRGESGVTGPLWSSRPSQRPQGRREVGRCRRAGLQRPVEEEVSPPPPVRTWENGARGEGWRASPHRTCCFPPPSMAPAHPSTTSPIYPLPTHPITSPPPIRPHPHNQLPTSNPLSSFLSTQHPAPPHSLGHPTKHPSIHSSTHLPTQPPTHRSHPSSQPATSLAID